MGFLDTLGRLGGAAMEKLEKRCQEIERYREEYRNLSDEALRKKIKHTSGAEQVACAELLRKRGYGQNN